MMAAVAVDPQHGHARDFARMLPHFITGHGTFIQLERAAHGEHVLHGLDDMGTPRGRRHHIAARRGPRNDGLDARAQEHLHVLLLRAHRDEPYVRIERLRR